MVIRSSRVFLSDGEAVLIRNLFATNFVYRSCYFLALFSGLFFCPHLHCPVF
jgi:hypothetical protein